MPTWHGPLEAEVKLFVCPSYVKGVSVLKNPFAPISAPGSEAKYASFVVCWPGVWPQLDPRPAQQRRFQHADKLRRALLGSVSDAVVRHAHCPVTIVRE